MKMDHPIREILAPRTKDSSKGIISVCSANGYVLEACMERSLKGNNYFLVEATCNQVNQFGGYMGMRPIDFKALVYKIAERVSFPRERIILGGDHLGPNPWKEKSVKEAMQKARHMVREYIFAGFTKIHLDPSMRLSGDLPDRHLDPATIAARTAELCMEAERILEEVDDHQIFLPVYVIGTDVPSPGGKLQTEKKIKVTRFSDVVECIELTKEAFEKNGLENAWERVVAVVVQLGVEFSSDQVFDYDRIRAKNLKKFIRLFPQLVFEGHSMDYQSVGALKMMVSDGIKILKIGPNLTFAFREALLSLWHIENELIKESQRSYLFNVVENGMLEDPKHWDVYYKGSGEKKRWARRYSYSDRIRYYWNTPRIKKSIETLLLNLEGITIPLPMLSQYMRSQYRKIRNGSLQNNPNALIKDRIIEEFEDYIHAINH